MVALHETFGPIDKSIEIFYLLFISHHDIQEFYFKKERERGGGKEREEKEETDKRDIPSGIEHFFAAIFVAE